MAGTTIMARQQSRREQGPCGTGTEAPRRFDPGETPREAAGSAASHVRLQAVSLQSCDPPASVLDPGLEFGVGVFPELDQAAVVVKGLRRVA